MLFNSPLFLFLFLPILFCLYSIAPKSARNIVLLIASLFFYAWGEPKFVGIVILSAVLDWIIGRHLTLESNSAHCKCLVSFAIVQNLSLIIYFKYMNLFVGSFNSVLSILGIQPCPWIDVALPIGISFIVFEKITYVIDLYRKKCHPAKSLLDYLLYVFLFPKLLAGPIIKYHDIAAQFQTRSCLFATLSQGILRFSMGFSKKIFIADTLGEVADMMFKMPSDQLGTMSAWLGVLCYTFQIYFDFSGYSDMAIGLCRMFGFHIMENFNKPYIAENFTDFWRRWHISLSTWIKDYLYIPLGGNLVPRWRLYLNLWLCFILSGLWHGANWTFVLWGAYHGFFLMLDKLCLLRWQQYLPRKANIAITFFWVMLGWTIFRAETLLQITSYGKTMFSFPPAPGNAVYIQLHQWFFLVLAIILSFIPATSSYEKVITHMRRFRWYQKMQLATSVVAFIIAIGKMATLSFNPFLYFRF